MTSSIAIDQTIINFLIFLGVQRPLSEFVWICIPILVVVLGSTLGVLVIVWLERKISAAVQQRIGPEYAGPLGIIQALLDGLKLILKEDIIPSKSDKWLFTLGPAIVVIPIVLSYLVVPFGPNLIVADICCFLKFSFSCCISIICNFFFYFDYYFLIFSFTILSIDLLCEDLFPSGDPFLFYDMVGLSEFQSNMLML